VDNKNLNNNLETINNDIKNITISNNILSASNGNACANSENLVFPIDKYDILFTITRNKDFSREGLNNVICKMFTIRGLYLVNLDTLSVLLGNMGIEKLNIFHIEIGKTFTNVRSEATGGGADTIYMEINPEEFINYLNTDSNFLNHNNNSLYILRGGTYLDIKNLFAFIENCNVNVGRGGSQRSHMLSPLDIRLTSYLMAMFNFNYNAIKHYNTFNNIGKYTYLAHKDMSFKSFRKVFPEDTKEPE
jgi:hypothetical protein